MKTLQVVIFRTLALLLAGLVLSASAAPAPAPAGSPPLIIVEQGTHKLMRSNADVSRVAVGNPATADVSLVNRRDLLVNGKAIGITSLIVWVKTEKEPRQYLVRVQLPVDPLKAQQPVDPELSKAMVDPGRGVEGQLPNLLAHRRATLAAGDQKQGQLTDRSSVTLESQVLTDVKIAEVSRKTLQRYGINLLLNNPGSSQTSALLGSPGSFTSTSYTPDGAGLTGTLTRSLQDAFGLVVFDASSNITAVVDMLEGRGLVHTLAQPSLLATSGQTASYLAGGEFPVPVTQGGASASGSAITIQYKEFGIRLSLTPTVLTRERIALKIAPEVSDLDFTAGIQVGGVAVPALTVRRTDTAIELGDGETFVISGLVSSSLTSNVNKVPWLGDLPVIGAFFKSNTFNRTDKELIMIVTPHLVRPLARNAQLPKLPGDEYNGKSPSFGHNVFLERGNFDSGFSR